MLVAHNSRLPQHIAVIMDGNGRWAELRRRNRTFGHLRGARTAKDLIENCSRKGIQHLTLYAFSTENWLRPFEEVSFLMTLLSRHLKRERATLVKNRIRFQAIGEIERLPASVQDEVSETIRATSHCDGMLLTFALSYGGRHDIVEATRTLMKDAVAGRIDPDHLDDTMFAARLQTHGEAEPDLLIRTSGESRLSNFMLWQCAYSEILITPTLWPDFTDQDLENALKWYSGRERRFGKTSSQIDSATNRSAENSAVPAL